MPSGGKRPGAGRPKGARNKRTRQMIEDAQSKGLLPHEVLASVARGEGMLCSLFDEDGQPVGQPFMVYPSLDQRIDAAKAAAPFYAPRLTSIEHGGGISVTRNASDLSDEELAAIAAQDTDEDHEGAGSARAAGAPDRPPQPAPVHRRGKAGSGARAPSRAPRRRAAEG